jgi:diaminopimelate epimerase
MMRFVKMHGLGNDYVYIDGFEQSIDDPAEVARQVSDRHFGIGSDGLIILQAPSAGDGQAHLRMRMFNADGSEAEMCGNGIRCVCKMAHDHGICQARPMKIETGNGILTLDYQLDDQGKVSQVTVDMGPPILEPGRIPVQLPDVPADQMPDQLVDHPLGDLVDWASCGGRAWLKSAGLDLRAGFRGTCVSMGNPHVTIYVDDVDAVPLESVGPYLETLSIFPNRINVHFVQVHSPGEVTMRTWERGSGITLACGTGACAVAVSGVLTGRSNRQLLAHLPGGDLQLEWRESDGHVYMTGPATEVFTGQWSP